MEKAAEAELLGKESEGRLLLRLAPPIMLAQLIQGIYNIVDSFFVGRYSGEGLTALSVIFPLQLIICALAVGTGVGVNTYMSRLYAQGEAKRAEKTAGMGLLLALGTWALFALFAIAVMRPYAMTGARSPRAIEDAVTYGSIVCAGSLGCFLESTFSKVHQSHGNMRLPMVAQIAGAVANIILDPLLIFGGLGLPAMGVAGAALATVIGQAISALITARGALYRPPHPREWSQYARPIYLLGYASILMQALYTVYIFILNAILATFLDEAVTVLGLYYKLQAFFFLPINGLQVCIVPILSYNYTQKAYKRCEKIMLYSFAFTLLLMAVGLVCFVFFPLPLLQLFSESAVVWSIGTNAFPRIGCGFLFAVFALLLPVFFQAIGRGVSSLMLSLCRQILCLPTLFFIFSRFSLELTWVAFPISEGITAAVGLSLYIRTLRRWQKDTETVCETPPNG